VSKTFQLWLYWAPQHCIRHVASAISAWTGRVTHGVCALSNLHFPSMMTCAPKLLKLQPKRSSRTCVAPSQANLKHLNHEWPDVVCSWGSCVLIFFFSRKRKGFAFHFNEKIGFVCSWFSMLARFMCPYHHQLLPSLLEQASFHVLGDHKLVEYLVCASSVSAQ
jgi:hypothetical protein